MGIVLTGRVRWSALVVLAGAFLLLQHVAHDSYYKGERFSAYAEPELRDPALEQEYENRAKTLYGFAFLAGGAFALVLLAPLGTARSRSGSTLSQPRTALIGTSATLLLTATFGIAYYGLGPETLRAWGPTFANYYFLLPVLILHVAYFALLSNVMCLLKGTVGRPAGLVGLFSALAVFLGFLGGIAELVFGDLFSWIELI